MSATIGINDLKFVIFGAGHDYTLADSGDGDVQVFSHPFVPLNSVNYAGQWYFLVPDENGDPLDAVKDDVAHCTFTPAIGATFDTAGEVTVECHYHREYVHDEETLVVDKTVSQKITVVNHGSVVDSVTNLDVYSDGYGFIRPINVNTVEVKDYSITQKNAVTKLSSFPWRATGLGTGFFYGFFKSTNLTDVSEFAYADVSNCTKFVFLFQGNTALSDISAIANWNVSKVTYIRYFLDGSNIKTLEPLGKWNTASLTDLERAFTGYSGTKLDGLENWNVSKVTTMAHCFDNCPNMTDATALANWDVSKVQIMEYCFYNSGLRDTNAFALWNVNALENIEYMFQLSAHIVDLSGLSNWVAELTTIRGAFANCTALMSISGIHGLGVHSVTNFSQVFAYCSKLLSLDGLEGWDVSNGQNFKEMFKGDPWIADISAIANWDMSKATDTGSMFKDCAYVYDISDLAGWRLNNPDMGDMFDNTNACYSSIVGKNLIFNAYYYYDYQDHQYIHSNVEDEDHPLTYPTYDATPAQNWGVTASGRNAFNADWINKPSWN